jgi:hypothetical protein
MDDATLERLIFDDALGALSPDASALLASYAQTLPGSSERLTAWKQLAATAKAALPTESVAEPLPPLPPFSPGRTVASPWRITRVGLSFAAVLLMGLGIGSWFAHPPAASPHTSQTVVAEAPTIPGVHGFWSSQRLLASAMDQRSEPSSAWHWTSLLNQPEIGEIK